MRRLLNGAGAAALTVTTVLAVAPGQAGALDASFQATAAGDGVRVTFTVPNAPLSDNAADFGGPVAQAVLDSIGESSAYASFPNPGAGPATSPALIRGASGGQLPVPDYPLFVSSKAPAAPKQEFGSGPYLIKAESDADSSAAAAAVGGDAGGQAAVFLSKVSALVESGADAITASATSDTNAFAAGPLRIGRVFSTASTTFGGDGNLKRTAETLVEGVSVDGMGVVLTPEGVQLAGSEGPETDLSSVNEALSSAQISVELLPQREADTGVVAPAVQVTQKDPSSGGTLVYKIGAASAFVDADLLPGASRQQVRSQSVEPVGAEPSTESETSRSGSGAGATPAAGAAVSAGATRQRIVVTPRATVARESTPAAAPAAQPRPETASPPMVSAQSDFDPGLLETDAGRRALVPTGKMDAIFAVLVVTGMLAVAVPRLGRLRGAQG